MEQRRIDINQIPAIIWGETSDKPYPSLRLSKSGCKADAGGTF